jgi:hypothetical protein
VELVQVEDALDLEDCFTDLAKGNVRRNTLEEDVCSASDYSVTHRWFVVRSVVMETIDE